MKNNGLTNKSFSLTKEQQLRALREARFKSSDGRTDEAVARAPNRVREDCAKAQCDEPRPPKPTGVGSERSSPSETKRKRGRPKLEQKSEPWIAAGMSKATYYRRQKQEGRK